MLIRARLLAVAIAVVAAGGQALATIPAHASPGSPPVVVHELKHDRSQPLRTEHASPLVPNGKGPHAARPILPQHASSKAVTASKSLQSSAVGTAIPSTSTNFEGVNNLDRVLPPDTNGDIGPHNYVQWVNLHFEIFDRSGKSLLGPSPGNSLWSGFGGVCDTTNQGDPVVRYDSMADRWVFTQFAFTTDRQGNPVAPFDQCLAISTTGDPTGSYYRYAFQISTINFNDYPKLAVWPDAYYMSFNYFDLTQPPANQFVGAGAWAFNRSQMLGGQAASAINFTTTEGGSLLPSDLDGSILPPTGSPNYFAAIDTPISLAGVGLAGNTLKIWKFHVDWTTPANSTFGTATQLPNFNVTVNSYNWDLCNDSRNCLTQPGTNVGLDPLSDRLMNRVQYRHFADGHESLVANHTVGVGSSGNQAAVRWYEIRNLSTTPTIYQQGTYSPTTDNRWMASIAMDQVGNIGVGYSVSSSTVSPSIRYTGRLVSDTLGTLPQGEATIVAGSGSQTSTSYRWGDYSRMAIDPTDDCTFWYTQEYYTTTSDHGWQTRVGGFKFPSCKATLSGIVRDGQGAMVANASVQAYQASSGVACCVLANAATTDSVGNYQMTLPQGLYKVWINVSGFPQQWHGGHDGTSFTDATAIGVSGATVLNLTLLGSIAGVLNNGNGAPVANSSVQAYQAGSGAACCTLVNSGATDAGGNYQINLPAGTYKLWVNPSGLYPRQWFGGTDGTSFTAALSIVVVGIKAANPTLLGAISGVVKDGSGIPVSQASVQAYQAGTGASCCTFVNSGATDAGGNFQINLPAGTYKVWINPPTGYPQQWYGGLDYNTATAIAVVDKASLMITLHN
jgi:hypothetical protein